MENGDERDEDGLHDGDGVDVRADAGAADVPARPEAGPSGDTGVPVVGVGGSASGLDPILEILAALPPDTGMAFVFVLHAAAKHVSLLPELLAARTAMPVRQAADGMRVEPNSIYTNPPGHFVSVEGDVLRTVPRPDHEAPLTSVNVLFRSLAEWRGHRAIAVVLSGAAGDGADGARAIAEAGGVVLVQRPDSAEQSHMPEETIATGVAHLVVPPPELATELVRLARHPYLAARAGGPIGVPSIPDGVFTRIFALLRAAHGVDFGQYKPATIGRRMQRRMAVHRLDQPDDYLELLMRRPDEVDRLFDDILIHVTRFFRDPETYEALAERAFPDIVAGHERGTPIRVWIPGCSTGEETYSIAIALLEFLGDRAASTPIQIFSTDVSERAVERARAGLYPESIAADVSRERLTKYFTRADGGYRVRQSVRELCVFARQDLTRDPPFSRLDLIVCRNVLIYIAPVAQKRLMGIFHYALKPGGFLMLGTAETVGQHSDLFAVVDKKHKLYASKARSIRPSLEFPASGVLGLGALPARQRGFERAPASSLHAEATQALLSRYAPAGVVVDDDMNIVQFRGQTGLYLEPSPGEPSLNLFKMARQGLLHGLRAAIKEARDRNAPSRREALKVPFNGQGRDVNVDVTPLSGSEKRHFLVVFEDMTERPVVPRPSAIPDAPFTGDEGAEQLQRELAASREYLQSIIQDMEAANEELQSANQEILSSNEELQSTNEELDTAKEELQSTNEELNTVNEELHERKDELSRVNSDLTNLLASVEVAIAMVGDDLRIRRFTPLAGRLLNLIPGDVGRSIAQIRPDIDCPDLESLIREVIDEVRPAQRDVRDGTGRWYSLRIRPFKDVERRINGAVLSVFDVDELRRKEAALAAARDFAEAIIDTIRQPLVVLDVDLRVRRANRAFAAAFDAPAARIEGRPITEVDGVWDAPALRAALGRIAADGDRIEDVRIRHDPPGAEGRTVSVNARRVAWYDGGSPSILMTMTFPDEKTSV